MSIAFGEESDSAGLLVASHGGAGPGDTVAQARRARLLEVAEMCPIHRLLTAGARIITEGVGEALVG